MRDRPLGAADQQFAAQIEAMRASVSADATRAARARILRAVDRAGAYTLSDEQKRAAQCSED